MLTPCCLLRSKKCLNQPEAGAAILFLDPPKNTNLVVDVEILLPLKFRWIPFNGFRGEVEKCLSLSEARAAILFFGSARKTQTWKSWDLASCKVSLNSVQRSESIRDQGQCCRNSSDLSDNRTFLMNVRQKMFKCQTECPTENIKNIHLADEKKGNKSNHKGQALVAL